MINNELAIKVAAFLGMLAVALGAFGAHALKDVLNAMGMLETWQSAVFYHLIHSVVLLALALNKPIFKKSFIVIALGISLFSGSLYLLAITQIKIFGFITPIGGLLLIIGWGLLLFRK